MNLPVNNLDDKLSITSHRYFCTKCSDVVRPEKSREGLMGIRLHDIPTCSQPLIRIGSDSWKTLVVSSANKLKQRGLDKFGFSEEAQSR